MTDNRSGLEGCPFCALIAGGGLWLDEQRHIVSFVPLNPVTDGHRLFVPRSHVTAREAPDRVAESFGAAAAYGRRFLGGADFNLILNCGPNASQTIEHLHVHLVPRRPNDGLRLPWTGQRRTEDQPTSRGAS